MPSHTLLYTPSLSVREPVFLSLSLYKHAHTHSHRHNRTPAHTHTHAQTGAGTNIRRNRRFSCDRTSLRRSETSETKKNRNERKSFFSTTLDSFSVFRSEREKPDPAANAAAPSWPRHLPFLPEEVGTFFSPTVRRTTPIKKLFSDSIRIEKHSGSIFDLFNEKPE